mgnify:CR=1 FL=1
MSGLYVGAALASQTAKVEPKWVRSTLVYKLADGRKVVVSMEPDDEGGHHSSVALNGKTLDGPEVDPDGDLDVLYAPTGIPFAELMRARHEVFEQFLRDEGHRAEAENERSIRWRSR